MPRKSKSPKRKSKRKSPKNLKKGDKSPRKPTSKCCCIGVRCICPNGKVCPSKNRDVSLLRLGVEKLESLLSTLKRESDRAFIRNLIKSKN